MKSLSVVLGASALLLSGGSVLADERQQPVEWEATPPKAPSRPVVEEFFGTKLVDHYRYMETPGDEETLKWMMAQGEHTRSILDAIPARAAYLQKASAFDGQFGFVQGYKEAGGRSFYLERPPGAEVFNLMVQEPGVESRTLVDVAALVASTGKPHGIDYYQPSADGSRIAVGISVGGDENSELTVIDAMTGARLAGPVANARFATPRFTQDGRLAFTLSQELRPDQPKTDTFLNRSAVIWDMAGEPVPIAGALVAQGPTISTIARPVILSVPGSDTAALVVYEGFRNNGVEIYLTPEADLGSDRAIWRKVANRDDGITALIFVGEQLVLLSNKDAPTSKVLSMPVTGSASSATEIVPARPDRVLEYLGAASDAVYIAAREGVYGKLLRVPLDGGVAEDIDLPILGNIEELITDPRKPGAVVLVSGWTSPPALYRYSETTREFTALPSGARPDIDFSRYATHDLRALAKDGVEVPLSVIAPSGPRQPRPVILQAYGSYGASQLPLFSPTRLAFLDEGAIEAVCHVRGGGELGEAWRLAGKDANKPNTWRDLIACAEHLISEGWTTPDQLAIIGASAGGIAVGRAMIERPDLFAAVISVVPMASAVRSEFQQNGPVNIVEFGTITDPVGFRNLLAMDAYFTIEDGKTYPPVMFTSGLNDTRVDTWQPAKAAARMQAAGSPNPVLLRVEIDGGHAGGSTKRQDDEFDADVVSFVFWRAGREYWQPVALAQ